MASVPIVMRKGFKKGIDTFPRDSWGFPRDSLGFLWGFLQGRKLESVSCNALHVVNFCSCKQIDTATADSQEQA